MKMRCHKCEPPQAHRNAASAQWKIAPTLLPADVVSQRGSAEVKERVVKMFFGADEESRLVWEAVRSLGRRNYYRGRRFSIPSINHYKIPIQEENVTGNTIAQRTDSRMQRKGKKTKLGDRDYYLLAPQHRAFASFCMKLGFSALCRVGCGFGLLAGAARLFCARLGWLCWNCACVEAPSGGASSPMLFRLICESRFIVSRGLLPG